MGQTGLKTVNVIVIFEDDKFLQTVPRLEQWQKRLTGTKNYQWLPSLIVLPLILLYGSIGMGKGGIKKLSNCKQMSSNIIWLLSILRSYLPDPQLAFTELPLKKIQVLYQDFS
jgi:hypothetical protein